MRSFFFVTGPLLPCYLGPINVDVSEKKRDSVDIVNYYYRLQIGEKLRLIKHVDIRKSP